MIENHLLEASRRERAGDRGRSGTLSARFATLFPFQNGETIGVSEWLNLEHLVLQYPAADINFAMKP